MNTVPQGAQNRAPLGTASLGAIYLIDVKAIRGSVGRLEIGDDWQYIIDHTSSNFRPEFDNDVDGCVVPKF